MLHDYALFGEQQVCLHTLTIADPLVAQQIQLRLALMQQGQCMQSAIHLSRPFGVQTYAANDLAAAMSHMHSALPQVCMVCEKVSDDDQHLEPVVFQIAVIWFHAGGECRHTRVCPDITQRISEPSRSTLTPAFPGPAE
jgi:hypothetical protein